MRNSFKEEEEFGENKDRISNLCDDMLLLILSNLEMKDAARTSILARRWRYLSTCRTNLDFNDGLRDPCRSLPPRPHESRRTKFLNWVNQVIALNSAPCLNQFSLCFEDLDQLHKDDIDRWISFALSRRVKKLEVDFYRWTIGSGYRLKYRILKTGDFSRLTTLFLRALTINGRVLQWVLLQCRLLENLHVEKCLEVGSLKVYNACPRLKSLAISLCHGLDKLEIDASNLLSFWFDQPQRNAKVLYSNVLSLREAFFLGEHNLLLSYFRPIACFSANLLKLYLEVEMEQMAEDLPCFPNVKHLGLRVKVSHYQNLLILTRIALSCPLLNEWHIEEYYTCNCSKSGSISKGDYTPESMQQLLVAEAENDGDETEAENDGDKTETEDDGHEAEAEYDGDETEAENDDDETETEDDGDEAEAEYDSDGTETEYDSDGTKTEYDSDGTETEYDSNEREWARSILKAKAEIEGDSSVTLPFLRKVEWFGEIDQHESDYLLPMYIVKNAPHLETFEYDPKCPYHSFTW